jgi:uncharacterized protein YlxW (UPF0749 family)
MHDLEARLADLQRRFNDVQAKKTQLAGEVSELDAELYRLQGENRILNQMKEKAADPATTIKAEVKKA